MKVKGEVTLVIKKPDGSIKQIVKDHNAILPEMINKMLEYSVNSGVSMFVNEIKVFYQFEGEELETKVPTVISEEGQDWVEWCAVFTNSYSERINVIKLKLCIYSEIFHIILPIAEKQVFIVLNPEENLKIFWKIVWVKNYISTNEYISYIKNCFKEKTELRPFHKAVGMLSGASKIYEIPVTLVKTIKDGYAEFVAIMTNEYESGTLTSISWHPENIKVIYGTKICKEEFPQGKTKKITLKVCWNEADV